MSAPNSEVQVCNLSLDLLKCGEQVADIENPQSEVEALANRWYDATRRSILRMFPWNFARVRDSISRLSSDPTFGYDDAYQLPNDYIGMVFVGENPETDYETDYLIEGRSLLINNESASSLFINYVCDFKDVAKFDPIFLMFLVGELSVVFANTLTGLNKSIKTVESFRDRWEFKARSKNGQENPPRKRYVSPLLNARRRFHRSSTSDGVHLF